MSRRHRLEDEARTPVERRPQRGRGVQPTFAERQEQWKERPQDASSLIPSNDAEYYRPETG